MKSKGDVDFVQFHGSEHFEIGLASAPNLAQNSYAKWLEFCLLLKIAEQKYFTDSDYVHIEFYSYKGYKSDKIILDKQPYCLAYENYSITI